MAAQVAVERVLAHANSPELARRRDVGVENIKRLFVPAEPGVGARQELGAVLGLPAYMNGIWYLSLMTAGVAFIAGRGGIAFIIGGFVAYWFISPMLSVTGAFPVDAAGQAISAPDSLRVMLYRPFGIGMLIGGAIMGVILAAPLILSAIKSMQKAAEVETRAAGEVALRQPPRLAHRPQSAADLHVVSSPLSSVWNIKRRIFRRVNMREYSPKSEGCRIRAEARPGRGIARVGCCVHIRIDNSPLAHHELGS